MTAVDCGRHFAKPTDLRQAGGCILVLLECVASSISSVSRVPSEYKTTDRQNQELQFVISHALNSIIRIIY